MTQNSKQSNRKLRKLGVGAASMMIGLTLVGVASANNEAHADADNSQSTIPVAAKPTTTTTNTNSTSTANSNNTNTNNNASTQQSANQSIKSAPAATNTQSKSSSTSEQDRLSAITPTILNNPAYNATATSPSVTDEQTAHGVYVTTGDSSARTAYSTDDNQAQSDMAIVNPTKTNQLTAHGVITNNSGKSEHVEAVYQLPYAFESESEVNQYVTLDSSRFDPSKGVNVNGGSNVQVSYSIVGGQYNDINHLPSDFDWSKVMYIMVNADLAAGQSMNVEMPFKIDTSKIDQNMIFGAKNYWANRFHVGETMFLINKNFVHATDLQMRFGAPSYDLNEHIGEYFLLAFRNSNGTYSTLPVSVYEMLRNDKDADVMKISKNNVHFMNYHPAAIDDAAMHSQAVSTNNDGDHIMWTGSVYYIDLPAMQNVLKKYGYSFDLKQDNSGVMDYYSYNNFGGKATVSSTIKTIKDGQSKGIKISPAMYIEVHQLLQGKDVTVQHGGS